MTWATITFEKVIALSIFILVEYASIKYAHRLLMARTIEEKNVSSTIYDYIFLLGILKLLLFAGVIGIQFGGD